MCSFIQYSIYKIYNNVPRGYILWCFYNVRKLCTVLCCLMMPVNVHFSLICTVLQDWSNPGCITCSYFLVFAHFPLYYMFFCKSLIFLFLSIILLLQYCTAIHVYYSVSCLSVHYIHYFSMIMPSHLHRFLSYLFSHAVSTCIIISIFF